VGRVGRLPPGWADRAGDLRAARGAGARLRGRLQRGLDAGGGVRARGAPGGGPRSLRRLDPRHPRARPDARRAARSAGRLPRALRRGDGLLGRRTVVLPALGLLAASIALLAAVRSVLALATAGLLFGTAQGFVYPTLNAFTIELAEPGQLGRTQTLYNGAFNLGTTAGSMALGLVAQ